MNTYTYVRICTLYNFTHLDGFIINLMLKFIRFSYLVTMVTFILSLTVCVDQFLFIENDFFSDEKFQKRNSIAKVQKPKRRSKESSQSTENSTTLSNAVETTAIPSPTRSLSIQTRGSQKINPPVIHESMERQGSIVNVSCDNNADYMYPSKQYVVSGCVMFDEQKDFIDNHEDYGHFYHDEEAGNTSYVYDCDDDDDDNSMNHRVRPHRDTLDLHRQHQEKNMDITSHQPRRSSISKTMWSWVKINCPGLIENNTDEVTNTDETAAYSSTDHTDYNTSTDTGTNFSSFGKYKTALDNDKEEDNMVHPYVRDGGSFQLRYFKV